MTVNPQHPTQEFVRFWQILLQKSVAEIVNR